MNYLYEIILIFIIPIALILAYLGLVTTPVNPYLNIIPVLIGSSISIGTTLIYKEKERKSTEKKYTNILKNEISIDLETINNNVQIINNELHLIDKEKNVYRNSDEKRIRLTEFKTSAWDIIKLNLPKDLEADISLIGDSCSIMEKINDYIRVKENYKATSLEQFKEDTIKEYNNVLKEYYTKLEPELKKLNEKVIYLNCKNP